MQYLYCVSIAISLFFSTQILRAEDSAKSQTSSTKKSIIELFQEADIQINGKRPQDIIVTNEKFYDRVLTDGSLGLGESYIDGWWNSKALDLTIAHILRAKLHDKVSISPSLAWSYIKAFLFNLQDKLGSKKVIDQHYNLGNDLYTRMLDPLMAYSCGYWKNAASLEEAQRAKFDLLCKKLKLTPGMTILDIGCGWGGFEKYAAENYGVRVVGVTLSENQAEFAIQLCKGLPVEIKVQDYRDIEGEALFDRIISIGMFEHVGSKNYKTFMQVCNRLLKNDGIFVLHTIGGNLPTVTADAWITRYIFPNGQIPSICQIAKAFQPLFIMEDWHNFGPDYAKTLKAWYANFHAHWPELRDKYDDRFYRMWKYYLLSCAGSFEARALQLWQIVLTKEGFINSYESIR